MCELMALAFNEAVHPRFSLRGFIHRGAVNPDGWGIAHYPDDGRAVQIMKEPLPSNRSTLAAFLRDQQELRSRIFISHVRWATSSVHYANTHPFSRVLRGREYAFAHNGRLRDYKEALAVGPWSPLGSTDSEYAFCHLMNIVESRIPRWNRTGFEHLEISMRRINHFGKFNCLLSDGEFLFCYRDKDKDKDEGLQYSKREAPFSTVKLEDEDFTIDLAEEKSPTQKGFIIATAPLTKNEEWNELEKGRLVVLRRGIPLFGMPREQHLSALQVIRSAPHRLSIHQISREMNISLAEAQPLIRRLCSDGLIRQDSRDTAEPFSPTASYYTVPEKRAKIDELLG